MTLTFEQRRRIVLTGFAAVCVLMMVVGAIFRHTVGGALLWLFSDSLGAVVLLTLASLILALRAKRRMALDPVRHIPTSDTTARHLGPPAGAMLFKIALFAAILLLLLLFFHLR